MAEAWVKAAPPCLTGGPAFNNQPGTSGKHLLLLDFLFHLLKNYTRWYVLMDALDPRL